MMGNRLAAGWAACAALLIAASLWGCSDGTPAIVKNNGDGDGVDGGGDGDGTGGTAGDGDGVAPDGGGDGDSGDGDSGDGDGDGDGCPGGPGCSPDPSCTEVEGGESIYSFCTAELTRDEAAAKCAEAGGGLVEITSAEENALVEQHATVDSWIGANAKAVAGDWVWTDGGDVFWRGTGDGMALGGAFTDWIAGHPVAADCAFYSINSMGWSGLACSAMKGFVCERLEDQCPDDPDKRFPGYCGCGNPDVDSDGDTYLDCEEECPLDVTRSKAGDCGCVGAPDPADEGAACDDGFCPANDQCDGAGTCGDPLDCCMDGVDTDGDSLPDCAELADDSPWTNPNVFNGFRATHRNQCQGSPSCGEYDVLSEIDSCVNGEGVIETRELYAGWDFQNAPDDITNGTYGFAPAFTTSDATWQVDYRGYIYLPTSGIHCFGVTGGTDNGCGSLLFDGATQALKPGGVSCVDRPAGIYPIRLHFVMDNSGANKSFHANYCAGGAEDCIPSAAIPSRMLRPDSPCGPDCVQDADVCTVHVCHLDGICEARPTPEDPPCPDDGDVCTEDVCGGGTCNHPPAANDTPCADDGDACTADVCTDGACSHPPAPDDTPCPDDGEACTSDVCRNGACNHPSAPDDTPCADDGNECTRDVCVDGSCGHAPHPDDTVPCAGNPCIDNEMCRGGFCVGGTAKTCDDGLPCTTDSCNQGNGNCQNSLQAGNCLINGTCYGSGDLNPGNPCQHCDPGANCGLFCNAETTFVTRPAGSSCDDDGLACTSSTCDGNNCRTNLTTGCLINNMCVPEGGESPNNECQYCVGPNSAYVPKADGTPCNGGTCMGGNCQ